MSEELALPTKESIKAAASKCPEAKEVLKVLFPKVFKDSYCCSAFEDAIKEGSIRKGDSGHWVFGDSWIIRYCPFCGKAEYIRR